MDIFQIIYANTQYPSEINKHNYDGPPLNELQVGQASPCNSNNGPQGVHLWVDPNAQRIMGETLHT